MSADAPWGAYTHLRPSAIEAIVAQAPVAYVPWGALEWHCQHAPIGLDSTKAEGLCVALAKANGGIVLPVIPLGVHTIKPFKGFAHTLDFSMELVTKTAVELCLQLADEGFRLVIFWTGHYPPEQFEALQAGVDTVKGQTPKTQYKVWADNYFLGESFKADHAGATETAFQMHFAPGSVDFSGLPDRPLTLDGDGVTGDDPREATPERGAAQTAVVVEAASREIQKAWPTL